MGVVLKLRSPQAIAVATALALSVNCGFGVTLTVPKSGRELSENPDTELSTAGVAGVILLGVIAVGAGVGLFVAAVKNPKAAIAGLESVQTGIMPQTGTGGASGPGSGSSDATPSAPEKPETYEWTWTCPSGVKGGPVTIERGPCEEVMKRYAKTMGCNLVDDMEAAQAEYLRCTGQ